jgi:hypothetical protein
VLHSNDGTPMHLFAKGVKIPEKAEGKGWMLAEEIAFDKLPTLPQLIVGEAKGRTNPDQVTCFLNNIGLGFQFAASARSSIAKRVKRASATTSRRTGSPKPCIRTIYLLLWRADRERP